MIDLYVDGELPEPLHRDVEQHLFRCATCSHEKQTMEQALHWLRGSVDSAELPPCVYDRTLASLKSALSDRLHADRVPDAYQLLLRLDG